MVNGITLELQALATEFGFIALYHNRQWRICDPSVTAFHQGGHFTGTAKQCLIWLAGYAFHADKYRHLDTKPTYDDKPVLPLVVSASWNP